MKKIIYIYVLLFTNALCSFAGDTTHVFFIGNSFTYYNDAPGLVKGFADAAGLSIYYQQHTPGGVSVGDLSQDTLAHWRNPSVFSTLKSGIWDYVVLQDNQGRFIYSYGQFPAVTVSRVIEGHIKIMDSMQFYNPCSHLVLFAGWGPKNGYLPYSSTGIGLIDSIYDNYKFLNDSMKQIISPIGKAWGRAMVLVGVDLWGPDSTHPSLEGSYLTASVIFSAIFRVNPIGINFTGGLDSVTARNLRTIAWQTVIDSFETTNLGSITVPVSQSGDTLTATGGYHSYQWYRNDTMMAGATLPNIVGNGVDCYAVIAYDSMGCSFKSLPVCGSSVVKTKLLDNLPIISIYPNPATDFVTLNLPEFENQIFVTDIRGVTLIEKVVSGNTTKLSVVELSEGCYFLKVISGNSIYRERFVISHKR